MIAPTVDEPLPPLRLGRTVAAVALGGALGTWVRILLVGDGRHYFIGWVGYAPLTHLTSTHWPSLVPWWLLGVNTSGVLFAAYILSGPLRGRSPDDPTRLFAITGLLGGFTSYSSLIVALAAIRHLSLIGAAVTLIGAIGAGIFAGWLGIRLARR